MPKTLPYNACERYMDCAAAAIRKAAADIEGDRTGLGFRISLQPPGLVESRVHGNP